MRWPVLLSALAVLGLWAMGQPRYSANPGCPWPATDGLGSKLPLATEVGTARRDLFVGIFYFFWLGHHEHGIDGP